MVRLLIDARDDGDRIGAHARHLLREQYKKSKNPIGIAASRALVPIYCSGCDQRCWGMEGAFFDYCAKCKGEGKMPIGFGA